MQNITEKQKCLNLGPKTPDFSIFGLEFENNIVIFEISTLKFVKNESSTHTVNFGIGPAFSEGPALGPSSLYKVRPLIQAPNGK